MSDDRDDPFADAEPGILGLDNVRLDLPIAGIGSRALAILVDYAVLGLLAAVVLSVVVAFAIVASSGFGWGIAFAMLALFLVYWGYFAAFEIVLEGRTPGKAMVGLRVVSAQGGRASAAAILVRNVLRSVDTLIGVPFIALDSRCRRLGDMVAGTLVVHDRPEKDAELRLGRVPAGWGPREVAAVEGFLRRWRWLETPHAERLAERVLASVARSEPAFVESTPAAGSRVETLRRVLEVAT